MSQGSTMCDTHIRRAHVVNLMIVLYIIKFLWCIYT